MPLQQINISPVETNKGNEQIQTIVSQMPSRSIKNQDLCGRCESQASSGSSSNNEICRICHCEGDTDTSLIAPCYCSGSLRYVHQVCLQQWIKSSNIRCCELCKFQFIMHTKTKPFMEWEPLEMTGFERRKLLCAVMFHAVALTCVVWSLYVLIDRTAEEIKHGLLEWPFWTKLIVVAIGFTGGVVFMYIQCKAYMQICQRWKAFNRVIYVQNAPEKQALPVAPPLVIVKSNNSNIPEASKSDMKLRDSGNFKEETSIDLKGVRNLHIFFNDENRVCVQNEQLCLSEEGEGSCEGGSSAGAPAQRSDDLGASWHIKIGKGPASDPTSSSSIRCSDVDNSLLASGEQFDQCRSSKSNEDYTAPKYSSDVGNDSVLKLQIKKSEIVIKFGQKPSGETSADDNSCPENKDTSVNIQIDDKEREPIVIDLVKKAPAEPKDPVQIRFDFGQSDQEKGCDSDESVSGSNTKLLDIGGAGELHTHSETDSGSQSPLLSKKNSAQFQPN